MAISRRNLFIVAGVVVLAVAAYAWNEYRTPSSAGLNAPVGGLTANGSSPGWGGGQPGGAGIAPQDPSSFPQGPGGMRGSGMQGGGSTPQAPGGNAGGGQDPLSAWERADMGVQPPRGLYNGQFHAPTPNTIPGGQLITTRGLYSLYQQNLPVHVFDVLGGPQVLPKAIPAVFAANPGSFEDQTQQQLAGMLRQVTGGANDHPLVFYCQGPQCWMSYNAALRAIALGHRNVLWYRGGLEAWAQAGLPLAGQGGGGGPGGGGYGAGGQGGQPGYGYGTPQGGYGSGDQPGYGAPQGGYGQGGQPGYGYGPPQGGYGSGGAQPGYGAPQGAYSAPQGQGGPGYGQGQSNGGYGPQGQRGGQQR